MQEQQQAPQVPREQPPQGPKGAKERLYDQIKIPLWVLDIVIWGAVALIAVLIIVGAGKAGG